MFTLIYQLSNLLKSNVFIKIKDCIMKSKFGISLALIFLVSGVAQSEPVWTNTNDNLDFFETDVSSIGDALSTLDYSTGLEWLDFSQTAGMSIDQVRTETEVGGRFYGWRLPTGKEVTTLFNNWFDYDSDGQTPQTTHWRVFDKNSSWTSTFADTFGYSNFPRSYALYEGANDQTLLFGVGNFSNADYLYFNYISGDAPTSSDSSVYFGVSLVSDGGTTLSSINDPLLNINNANAPVNNVSAFGFSMVTVAMMGLLGFRRRQS